ncbi:MAG TPA: hypothetical protein VGI86_05750, partial [Acidimicrobiia bacterium]
MARDVALLRDPQAETDDVATQVELWSNAFGELGYAIRQADHNDVIRNGDADAIAAMIDGCALVVAANVCSVPSDARAFTVANALRAYAARGGRVIFHHHALPWDPGWRDHEADAGGLPPRIEGAVHVGVSLRARRDLQAHGYAPAFAIHDHYEFDAPAGARDATREALGFDDDEIVLYQSTAATRNTNVAGAVRFVTALHAAIPKQRLRYWLRGPVHDDVAPTVERLLEHCPVPTTLSDSPTDRRDAMAASDVVLLPSTWDPSGATAIEAIIANRPCVVGTFPVLGEMHAIGLRFFSIAEPVELVKFLARPNGRVADVNLRRARLSFSAEHLPAKLADVLMT